MSVMHVRRLTAGTAPLPPGAVTIGTFDGLHRGHQQLIALTHNAAQRAGLVTTVLTFDRHPLSIVCPERSPRLLTTLEQKLRLLDGLGVVDHVVVVPFDEWRSRQRAEDFVAEVVTGCAAAKTVVVGEGFRFGAGQAGDVRLLGELGRRHGFGVIPARLEADGSASGPYSSTRVRRLIAAGDLAGAQQVLGRPFEVVCRVSTVDGGLELEADRGQCLPPPDVYLGSVRAHRAGAFGALETPLLVSPTGSGGRMIIRVLDATSARPDSGLVSVEFRSALRPGVDQRLGELNKVGA
jgi:riboflavin kinase / FMN adenylyltransferase